MKKYLYNLKLILSPVRQIMSISILAYLLELLPVLLLFGNANRFGGFGWPLLFLYFGFLAFAHATIIHVRERNYLQWLYGEEEYYRLYPEDLRWRRLFDLVGKIINSNKLNKLVTPKDIKKNSSSDYTKSTKTAWEYLTSRKYYASFTDSNMIDQDLTEVFEK